MDGVAVSCPAEVAAPEARPPRPAVVRDLGRQAYEPVWHAMQRF
ncbi:MAG: lipoyl(octanoyl) transferase, partial [Thermomonas sp.]